MEFGDQFDIRDPLKFDPIGLFDLWPRQIAWEARALLAGRTTAELKVIAQHIDETISAKVAAVLEQADRLRHSSFEGNPKTRLFPGDIRPLTPAQIRTEHGDINLLTAAISEPQLGLFGAAVAFSSWEGYAVLALWKLIDWHRTISPPGSRQLTIQGQRRPLEDRHRAFIDANPLILEALRACTLAAEGKLVAEQMAALKTKGQREVAEAVHRAEQSRRARLSEQNRQAVVVRHDRAASKREQAVMLAISQPFKGYADAARYVVDRLEKSPGKYFTTKTIEGWLKRAGWKPSDKRSTA
jgi:hypothetical protein